MPDKHQLEELAQFIRTYRSNETNFERLYERLTAEHKAAQADQDPVAQAFATHLQETKEKQAEAYREHKEKNIASWAEFETFVTHFEKAVTEALHQA